MKIEVEVDSDNANELLKIIEDFQKEKLKEQGKKTPYEKIQDWLKELSNIADSLQVEEYCLHNHRDLTEEDCKQYQERIDKLEEKESELAKNIAYTLYRGEVIILDKDYEPF